MVMKKNKNQKKIVKKLTKYVDKKNKNQKKIVKK